MGDNLTVAMLQVGGRERGGTPVEGGLLIEEKARKTYSPSSFFFSGKVNGVRCAEIYECRMSEVGSTNVHFFSLTLTPVSPPFSSSLLRNYLLVVLPGNRRGKKGG